jgi:hypothetical protein
MGFAGITLTRLEELIGQYVEPPLLSAGFEKSARRHYVRCMKPLIRDVVSLRGDPLSLLFTYGLSFDFAPHISGIHTTQQVRWHRSNKTAQIDLMPGLESTTRGWNPNPRTIWGMRGEEHAVRDAQRIRDEIIPSVLVFFSSVNSIHDLQGLFDRKLEELGDFFFNYYQLSLSYAFFLAKVGREKCARKFMSEWLLKNKHWDADTLAQLTRLFELATDEPVVTN